VAEVRFLEGPAVWAARERGEFSASLMEAAAGYTRVRSGVPLEDVLEVGKDGDSQPGLVLLKYCDGLRLAMLLIPNVCGIPATIGALHNLHLT
jgi:nitrogen fixation protein